MGVMLYYRRVMLSIERGAERCCGDDSEGVGFSHSFRVVFLQFYAICTKLR